uniref:Phospholipase n=1 Tax=Timema monikensis TaxID=170555 RepID=A0A7R9E0A6_9NEOP|nr:unnamed protein product [Timema monikensis]
MSLAYVLCIPFGNIHNPPHKFKDPQRRVFIPGTDIDVNIIEYDRSVTTHLLNPNLTDARRPEVYEFLGRYTIELMHGGYTWTIKKRFPNKPDSLVLYENIDHRIMQLESYLRNLLKIKMYRNHPETLNFLEVSHLSFVSGLGAKGKEGMVQKKSGSTQPGRAGCNLCGLWNNILCIRCSYICNDLCGKWHQRWFFIKDTFMGYITPKDGRVKCVMLFDLGFEVSSGMYATGLHHGLQLVNLTRHLQIKCWTRRKRKEWLAFIKDVTTGSARDFTHRNRHNSFAPERLRTDAAWFVDGCSYMSAVADALDAAKEEIFIADWWLSPEIYLKRPITDEDGDFWRLDKVLARKAEAGVKVFVMLYKEVEIALGINSYYSKQRLVNSHPNIKVLRHPDHAKAGVFLWAHHEKIVVVDQTYAFLGGLDLCYGRWDDHEHRLTDIGSGSQTLGLFPPLRRKQTSSHPLAGSTPSVLRHLAVAGNTIGGSMLHTSQNNLAVVPVEEPTVFVPKHAHFKAQTSSNLIRSERDQTAADKLGNMAEHVKGNTPPPERRLIDRMTQRRTLDYWIGRTPHAEDSEDEDYIHIGSAIKSPTLKENFMEMVRELRERKTRWIPSFHKSPDNDEALPTSGGTAESPNPANLSNGTKEVSVVVDRSNNPPIIISSSETDVNSNKGIAGGQLDKEKQEEWREGEKESRAAGDSTGLPKGVTPIPGLSTALPKYWLGKDYTNFIVKDFNNLDSPYQDLVDRNMTPRMPWHDMGVMVQGAAARDVARHFIHRWNAIKLEKAKVSASYPHLLPKSYEDVKDGRELDIRPVIEALLINKVDCQVLRSVSSWSAGFLDPDIWEESIHEAYIDTITRAKHYIYIENQFFITLGMHGVGVRNQIGEALFKRIIREGSVFRVYVVMPLLPGFEGEVGSPSGTALHAITHWNYASISRGKNSILNRLKQYGVPNPSDYISFYGLRTHSILDGDLVTELIYVHSKLLIADDVTAICGSANINDRSMLGRRDSEIAVIIHDCQFDEGVMNGSVYQSGRFVGGLRRHLFREHLGLLIASATAEDASEDAPDISDPVSTYFYRDVWMKTAKSNTNIYEQVFRCIPTDQATDFQALRKYQCEDSTCYTDPPLASKMLEKVKGHLVNLPLHFLENEVLTPNPSSVQGMMPTSLWT